MAHDYPLAKAAARRIHPHFMRHIGEHQTAESPAAAPDLATVEALVDAAFWASLRREEGFVPKISLAFVEPEQVPAPMLLERPLPLSPHKLTRVAPAVERPGIHLGVSRRGADLVVWGATRRLPPLTFVLEVVTPGVLVVKHARGVDSAKFVNIAVLEGDRIRIIHHDASALPDCPAILMSLLDLETHSIADSSVLIQMAISMRAHGRGGALLVLPARSETWQESILRPITYAVAPPFAGLRDLMRDKTDGWRDRLRHAVEGMAGLTAVDGATLMTDDYRLLAFGAKIVRRPGFPMPAKVMITEPIEGVEPKLVDVSQIGGTRHLSAAQFVHDQRDGIALVASQDGRFTVFGWSPCAEVVQAHRIETLLL